mmetsp:Transcript_10153/g.11069  ORF Transcript_10153/g.11069 Transcript_10153/m.11069 type:complete len:167 (+) Transcript_10153:27-527(+)
MEVNQSQESSTVTRQRFEFVPTKILDNLYISGSLEARQQDNLKQLGITHVAAIGTGLPTPHPDLVKYFTLDVKDDEEENLGQYFPVIVDFIDRAMEENGTVLVHCRAGVSRSSTSVCAYLMHEKGMSRQEAFKFVKQRHSNAKPNASFWKQLETYELKLKNSWRSY